MNIITLRKLSYDEVARCNKCGFCLPHCPIYLIEGKESASPRGRNAITRAVIEGRLGWSLHTEKSVFSCLGCGACTAACFPKVETKDLTFRNRECLVNEGLHPPIAERVAQYIEEYHNISSEDNTERGDWQEWLEDLPEGVPEKDHADVIFFVGCVSSFYPMAQKIPVAMSRIMLKAGVDFTILAGEEWCCGFPLIGAGMPEKIWTLREHNLRKLEAVGATSIVFTGPSCYHTWKHFYQPDVTLYHASQMLEQMIKNQQIPLKEIRATAAYHDPCDLGRNSGVFDAPRAVLKAIPGITLVELAHNREWSMCCGGGGNLEMVDPELSAKVARLKINEIIESGADIVVTSCQQCVRTIATTARRNKIKLRVKDLTEIVAEALA